jgi:hypothetical protein
MASWLGSNSIGIGYSIAIRLAMAIPAFGVAFFLIATGLVSREFLQQFFTNSRPDVKRLVDISAMRNDPVYFWLTLTLSSFVVAGLREETWRGWDARCDEGALAHDFRGSRRADRCGSANSNSFWNGTFGHGPVGSSCGHRTGISSGSHNDCA